MTSWRRCKRWRLSTRRSGTRRNRPAPAQPALVPLTFSLSSGATQSAPIPARSQAAANPPGGNPIVFETQAAFLATPASLQAVLSVVPEVQGPTPSGDLILNNLADLQSGKPTRLFNP